MIDLREHAGIVSCGAKNGNRKQQQRHQYVVSTFRWTNRTSNRWTNRTSSRWTGRTPSGHGGAIVAR
jgi:hypothetical protein